MFSSLTLSAVSGTVDMKCKSGLAISIRYKMTVELNAFLTVLQYFTCCLSLRVGSVPYSLTRSVYWMGSEGFEDGDGSS